MDFATLDMREKLMTRSSRLVDDKPMVIKMDPAMMPIIQIEGPGMTWLSCRFGGEQRRRNWSVWMGWLGKDRSDP